MDEELKTPAAAPPFKTIAVIGGGAWGTALASLAARAGVGVTLWAREPEVVSAINESQENAAYLPGIRLAPGIVATGEIEAAIAPAEGLVFAVPVQHARTLLAAMKGASGIGAPVMLCSKGIETGTGRVLTEILAEVWADARPAVLSGPSFARDVALGQPTAVTLAATDPGLAARWAATLSAPHFRIYLSDDPLGAEVGGAVKNVLAIAAGAVIGRGLGESARAAVIARGFAEMQRFALALGARRETLAGLSGLGDLILTAGSPQSRNYALGLGLGEGKRAADILAQRRSVAEGAATAAAVVARAAELRIDMPIARAVADLVNDVKSIDVIAAELLARPMRAEAL